MSLLAIAASGTKKILLYYLSTQFFLHFQYNGWFTFAVLGLFLKLAEDKGIRIDKHTNRIIFVGLYSGTILTFFLSLFWGDQSKLWLLWIASLGGFLQLTPILFYWRYLRNLVVDVCSSIDTYVKMLISVALACFVLKLVMQVIIVIPDVATLAFTIRNYVIAFIHLVFIGMTTLFLFAWAFQHKIITLAFSVKLGVISLVAGFILVESVLVIQGTFLWMGMGFIDSYYPLLFLTTILLPLGLLLIIIKRLRNLPIRKQRL